MFKVFERVKVEARKQIRDDVDVSYNAKLCVQTLILLESSGYDVETVLHEVLMSIETNGSYIPDYEGKCRVKPNKTPKLFKEDY